MQSQMVHRSEKASKGGERTPTNQTAGKGKFLKTLVTKDGKPAKIGERAYNPKTGKHVQITLDRAIQLLPTPTAMDHLPQRGYESMVKQTQVHRKGRTKLANLREAVNPRSVKLFNSLQNGEIPSKDLTQTGQDMFLNPAFVEEMMGYPIGYCV